MTRANADLDHLDRNGRSIAIGDIVRWREQATNPPRPYFITCEARVAGWEYSLMSDGSMHAHIMTDTDRLLDPKDVEVESSWGVIAK